MAPVGSKDPSLVLLTNGRGGMARLCVDLGRVTSKYDCLLGANLHPALPVDRHVMAKRVRVWAMANGFLSPLNHETLADFELGSSPRWEFQVPTGDGRRIAIQMTAAMVEGENTTVLRFARGTPKPEAAPGRRLADGAGGSRGSQFPLGNETQSGGGGAFRIAGAGVVGSGGLCLRAGAGAQSVGDVERGYLPPRAGVVEGIPHPVEATRGMTGAGDAYSPGWFELPLPTGNDVVLTATCEGNPRADAMASGSMEPQVPTAAEGPSADRFGKSVAPGDCARSW
jgi:starch synthase (maltosyl-transferring)